jgi:hypothetical protein
VAPEHGNVGARPTSSRALILDQAQIVRAFQKVTAYPAIAALSLDRPFTAREHDAAVQCAAQHRDCQVVDDGLFVTITDVALVPASGELRVHCSALWSNLILGEHYLTGYQIDLFLAHDRGAWKVVRRGGALTM